MEGQDQSPAAPSGYNKISPGVYQTTLKIKYKVKIGTVEREKEEIFKVTIDSNKGNFEYVNSSGILIATGNPVGKLTFADLGPEYPSGAIEEIRRTSVGVKQMTVDLVSSNSTVPDNEKTRILNSPYYNTTPPSTQRINSEGPVTSGQELNNLKIEASKESQKFGTMRYPLKSGGTNLDYIKFEIFESVPSKFGGYPDKDGKIQGRIGQFTNKEYAKLIGTIYLPIQPNIGDVNAVDWGEDTMGLLQMTAANISLAITGGGAATTENIADQISLEAAANRDDIIKAVRASLADTLAKSGSNVFTRVTGAMLNPNLELLFKGPKLRQFDYTIRLTPRSPEEGNMVRKIIRAFKQNMAPRLAANNYFLQTPNVFSIDYVLNNGTNIKGLNKIKKSALMSCSVNYTPANNYMPFKDGTMTSYELTLRFQELLPIYDSDYLSEFTDAELNTEESATDNITIGY